MATIFPAEDFDAEEVAKALRKAMKGFGSDDKAIIQLLTTINNEQRQEVRGKYKTMLGRDLIADLKSELGGKLESTVLALVEPPAVFDARSLHAAMDGVGTDETVISEILASRTNAEIQEIKAQYAALYKKDLEEAVMSEVGGALKRIYVSMLQGSRPEGDETDAEKAEEDARALKDAGEDTWGTDESEFNRVFINNNSAQLRLICEKYRELSEYDLRRVVEKEMSGDLEFAFVAVLECARRPAMFFAERAYRAMKGMGTDDATLIRVIVSRAETDLEDVKAAFMEKYDKVMAKMVKLLMQDDCGGDYERLLLAIMKA